MRRHRGVSVLAVLLFVVAGCGSYADGVERTARYADRSALEVPTTTTTATGQAALQGRLLSADALVVGGARFPAG